MLHHEESPEKPQYNMDKSRQNPHFASPLFSSKNFQTPPFPSILKKSNPPLYEGGGSESELCFSLEISWKFEISFIFEIACGLVTIGKTNEEEFISKVLEFHVFWMDLLFTVYYLTFSLFQVGYFV